jgi:hypothetical protein
MTSNTASNTYYNSDAARPRDARRETLSSLGLSGSDSSVGFRMGVSRNYGFGLSDPSLRPAVPENQ